MGIWKWEGLDKAGKRVSGQLDAITERDARKSLRAQGIRPRKISPPSIFEFDINQWLVEKGFATAFGAKELTNFTKQLAIMVNAGVPILQGLEILYKSEKNVAMKNAVQNIAKDVQEGKTLAESMSKQRGFDKLYCNLVRAGEIGGILDLILNKLAIHMDKQERTKAQIKSAMTYPFLVSFIGSVVVWGLVTFVVPQFVDMLKDSGKEVPGITQFVMDMSDFFVAYSIYIVPVVILCAVMLSSWIKTPIGKVAFDKFTMKLPAFGQVVIKGNLSSFSRTLGTLLGAGVSLIDALEICIETIDNTVIADDIRNVKKSVVEGKTLTEPLLKIAYFPEMVAQMIKVGEQTGSIDQMLEKISNVFEEEVNNAVTAATKLMEPLILVVLGGAIALVLVAIYLPMFIGGG